MSRCAQRIVHARYLLRSRAVTRIVAVFRGHICRHEKRLREGRREAASIVLQGGARKWHSRKAAAAARIQARARGIIGRDGLAKRRHLIAMSTRMQSCARGGLPRQQMARLRLLCAAHCVVARNWRGFATRNARWQAALRKHGEWLTVAVFVQASNHERARPSSVRFSGDARASPVLRGRRACGACLRASAREREWVEGTVHLVEARVKFYLETPAGKLEARSSQERRSTLPPPLPLPPNFR